VAKLKSSSITNERSVMNEDEIKSALVFYSIEDDSIVNMSINDIWNNFIIAKREGVSCRNVFHFEASPQELLSLMKSKNIDPKLFEDIKSEFDLGAQVMFVSPVVGDPIGGFLAHNFFSH